MSLEDITLSLEDVLKLFLGGSIPNRYSVYCETNHDEELLNKRLPLTEELVYKLVIGMAEIADTWRDDGRYSAKECAKFCDNFLKELLYCVIPYMEKDSVKQVLVDLEFLSKEEE